MVQAMSAEAGIFVAWRQILEERARQSVDARDAAYFDPWTRDYALLGLQLDRCLPGTVLAWLGPPAWRENVVSAPMPTPAALHDAADDLLNRLPGMGYSSVRAAYLARQVTALGTLARLAGGAALPLTEQAKRLLDIHLARTPEATLAAAHAELDALLPGAGSLVGRYEAWQRAGAIPVARLAMVLERIADEVRARTRRHLALPDGESIAFLLGPDLPYSAYTRYLGSARSRIEVNTRVPLHAAQLVDYLAHEAYPGHHTEHVLREERQYRRGAQGEYAIQLSPTPAALISEAIATTAPRLIFAFGEDMAWLAARVLSTAGVPIEPERDARIWAARRALDAAQGNAAFLLHEDGCPATEVAAYLARWTLLPLGAAQHFVGLLQGLPWRVYTFTYTHGPPLLAPLLASTDPFAILEQLMTEPVYPALLARGANVPG